MFYLFKNEQRTNKHDLILFKIESTDTEFLEAGIVVANSSREFLLQKALEIEFTGVIDSEKQNKIIF